MNFDLHVAFERLHAIAQTGLTYSTDPYDLERFREVAAIAEAGLADLLRVNPDTVAAHYAVEVGYPTPKIDVRAAVFRDNRILLVREAADGLWTMPGGWADETDSPKQAAEREVFEESGFEVRVTRLIALKNRRARAYVPRMLGGCYKLFFLAELVGGAPKASLETSEVGFFDIDGLPELSLGRTLPEDITEAFAMHRNPTQELILD